MAIRGVLGVKRSTGEGVGLEVVGNLEDLETEHVAVTLEDFCVQRLFSKDGLRGTPRGREGALTFNVNGQETSLSWATDKAGNLKNKEEKLTDYLLFLGQHKGSLDLKVGLIETDKDVVDGLKKARASMNWIAAIAGLTGVGTIVTAGLSVLGSIVDFIRGQIDDDEELAFYGSIGRLGANSGPEPLGRGLYRIYRKSDEPIRDQDRKCAQQSENDLEVVLRIEPYKPLPVSEELTALVMLDSIGLDLSREVPLDSTLLVDLSMGGGSDASKISLSHKIQNDDATIDRVLGLHQKILYRGTWNAGIPFSASVATTNDSKELETVAGVIDELAKQGKKYTEKKPVQERIDNITKAIQTYRAMIIEFLSKKISVGNKSGLITDRRTVVPGNFGAEHFILLEDLKPTSWKTPDIHLRSEKGGKARIRLRIKLEPPDLSIATGSLAEATVGQAYDVTLKSAGGTSSKQTWKGSLPCGLSISNKGRITGTPTTAGVYDIKIRVEDTAQPIKRSATKSFRLRICG